MHDGIFCRSVVSTLGSGEAGSGLDDGVFTVVFVSFPDKVVVVHTGVFADSEPGTAGENVVVNFHRQVFDGTCSAASA